MIQIGEYQTLTIRRKEAKGVILADEDGHEVLMPRRFVTHDMEAENEIEVFVYGDSGDVLIATTEDPYLTLGQFAYLKVTDVKEIGAFCDWGISKDLFIPFSNQAVKLRQDYSYVVHLYLDERSNRLVGTTKIRHFLKQEADEGLQMGQEVDLLVYDETGMGYKVIVNQTYAGLVYKSELFKPLFIGQELNGYVKPIRGDGKIDISLSPIGHQSIEPNARKILDKLEKNDGFLAFTDKSDPDLIRSEFGISKKLFKKSLGTLYKRRLVLLKDDGIYSA